MKYLACRAVGVGITIVRCGGEEEVEPCQVHMLMEDCSSEANNYSNRALFVDFCGFVNADITTLRFCISVSG